MNDKLNVYGMPARRLVWLDADLFIRHNIDELCELPEHIELASALNILSGAPSYVFSPNSTSRFTANRKPCIASYLKHARDTANYTFLWPHELRPPPDECPFIINAGLLVVKPLNTTAFNAEFVEPMKRHAITTYDGGDQGIVNSLLHGPRKLWGADRWAVLHPRFNNVARGRLHSERAWKGLPTSVLHHTGLSGRPWLLPVNRTIVSWPDEWYASGCTGVGSMSMPIPM